MKVFLFYRTDNWNSRESKDLVYIGTNREASIKKLMRLESEPIEWYQEWLFPSYLDGRPLGSS